MQKWGIQKWRNWPWPLWSPQENWDHTFHSHTIRVLTNYPLRQVLQKPDALGRLLKWAIELSQVEMEFQPRPVIKGQALVDFIVNLSHIPEEQPEEAPGASSPKIPQWGLYVDGSSNDEGSEASLILINPEDIECIVPSGLSSKPLTTKLNMKH